ncbi:MAG: hypothetical protein ABR923_14055 [Terracidiphilus sp.]
MIDRIASGGQELGTAPQLKLTPDQQNFEIHYAAINLGILSMYASAIGWKTLTRRGLMRANGARLSIQMFRREDTGL